MDDAKAKLSMKKEYSLSELFVTFTKIERLVNYVVRQFNVSDKHFILIGQNFVGKSAIIKRIVNRLEMMSTDYNFIWIDCTGRFDLVEMQKKLSAISLTNKKAVSEEACFEKLIRITSSSGFTLEQFELVHNYPQSSRA